MTDRFDGESVAHLATEEGETMPTPTSPTDIARVRDCFPDAPPRLSSADVVPAEMSRVRGNRHAVMVMRAGDGDGFTAVCLSCGPIVGSVPLGVAHTWADVHAQNRGGDRS